jgi:antibiotic biosynthesis monooxygenase (ABM) superfamily enzyme
MNAQPVAPAAAPVTMLVTRRLRKAALPAFEATARGMIDAASSFAGHMGGHLIVPDREAVTPLAQILFAFDSQAHLDAWMQSRERAAWLEKLAPLTFGDTAMNVLTGLEGWFALPSQATRKPPPRHKMALVTWLGIFPLVLLLSSIVAPRLAPLGSVLSVAVVTALVVVAMTWLVMPLLTRLLAGWLFPIKAPSP